jgi:thymidine kinase
MTEESGYLHITLGPMYSGKTTSLIHMYNRFKNAVEKIVVINYSDDKRYHDSMLSSHDKVMIPCTFSYTIGELITNGTLDDADIIMVNEGQFFSDIFETVIELVENRKKHVYIVGLDGDFRRNKFGRLIDLIPYCDDVIKLKAKCASCQREGIFSHRKTSEEAQIVIGSDIYLPLCRFCYLKENRPV